jgi:hypothetical protein
MTNDEVLLIDVPDDSILASKQLIVRPIGKMRLKHLRAFQRVVAAGKLANMDDMALALSGALEGWSEAEVGELTLDEMLLVIEQMDNRQKAAVPNGNGSSFTPPLGQTI